MTAKWLRKLNYSFVHFFCAKTQQIVRGKFDTLFTLFPVIIYLLTKGLLVVA